jgi:hypothetical protein
MGFPHALTVTGPDHTSSEHSAHLRLPINFEKCFMSQSLAGVQPGVGRGFASDADILLLEPCHPRSMVTSLCVCVRSPSTFDHERVARSLANSSTSHVARAGWSCSRMRRCCAWPVHTLDISAVGIDTQDHLQPPSLPCTAHD